MRLLLDTQVLLWFMDEDSRIPERARVAMNATENAVLVSAVALWEIAIKAAVGRLQMAESDIERLPSLIEDAGFEELPILGRHAVGVHALPMHHRDPFDRLLIAQARAESLTLVTADPAIRAYDAPVL